MRKKNQFCRSFPSMYDLSAEPIQKKKKGGDENNKKKTSMLNESSIEAINSNRVNNHAIVIDKLIIQIFP